MPSVSPRGRVRAGPHGLQHHQRQHEQHAVVGIAVPAQVRNIGQARLALGQARRQAQGHVFGTHKGVEAVGGLVPAHAVVAGASHAQQRQQPEKQANNLLARSKKGEEKAHGHKNAATGKGNRAACKYAR